MRDVGRKFRVRAEEAFARRDREIGARIDRMMADHSAKVGLRSGATIRRSLDIFEEESTAALEQVLGEAAKLIEHRGRQWTAAMFGISEAIAAQIERGPARVDKAKRVAGGEKTTSINRAIDERLITVGEKLRERLTDFEEGWTAPRPKHWKDRHPFLYALALVVIGSAVGLAVLPIKRSLSPEPSIADEAK